MVEDKRRPDFIVIGSARCGTTSLWKWFLKHPEIFVPGDEKREWLKEPSFFCTDEGIKDFDEYLSLFNEAKPGQVKGEMTIYYMVDPVSPGLIYRYLGRDIKLFAVLRNPAERAFSLWKERLKEGFEWIDDFETALSVENRRFYDPDFRKKAPGYFWSYMYWRSGLYYEQISRYKKIFGDNFLKNNFRAFIFEELVSNPKKVLKEICNFLGVKYFDISLPHEEMSKVPAIPKLQVALRLIDDMIRRRPIRGKRFLRKAIDIMMKINIRFGENPKHHWAVDFLKDAYKTEVEKLSELLGVDFLSIWYQK